MVVVPCARWVRMPVRTSSAVPAEKEAPPPPWYVDVDEAGDDPVAGQIERSGARLGTLRRGPARSGRRAAPGPPAIACGPRPSRRPSSTHPGRAAPPGHR